MVIANIIGGLGNQMFQYACGRAVSLRLGCPFKIATDQFENYNFHNGFELNNVFNLDVNIATKNELTSLLGWKSNPNIRRLIGRSLFSYLTKPPWISEQYFEYLGGIKNLSAPLYLHGYWQSELYFKDIFQVINNDFVFTTPLSSKDLAILEKMQSSRSLSVHVRRGDYNNLKNKKIFSHCGIDYYRNAIEYIRERFSGVKIFIFSDDHANVKSNFEFLKNNFELINHNVGLNSSNDMRLMSNSSHNIIANSTFSWWGAWLNKNNSKIVIAPKKWFVNNSNETRLIPKSWVRL